MQIKITFLATMLVALGAQAQSGGYANTCSNNYIYNGQSYTLLYGQCGNGHGGWNGAEIDLDDCFGNSHGYIVYQHNGGFAGSCKDIHLDGSMLSATCGDGNGGWGKNQVDLNNWIGNSGGDFVC